jgi:hypothetical protein
MIFIDKLNFVDVFLADEVVAAVGIGFGEVAFPLLAAWVLEAVGSATGRGKE